MDAIVWTVGVCCLIPALCFGAGFYFGTHGVSISIGTRALNAGGKRKKRGRREGASAASRSMLAAAAPPGGTLDDYADLDM